MPGSPVHLTRRFFDVLLARPLREEERAEIMQWLSPAEAVVFFEQGVADQRHGHTAALSVLGEGLGRVEVRAALLHDIGKRHARLGVIGRVVASLLILARIPLRGRLLAYREHGEAGAAELEALGAEPLVVDFARHHHQNRPSAIDETTWSALVRADHTPKPGSPRGQG